MNRGHTSASLKNLAHSIHTAILNDFRKNKPPHNGQNLTRTKSTIQLSYSNTRKLQNPLEQSIITKAQLNEKKAQLLIKIQQMELEIEQQNTAGKGVIRSYDKELQLYDLALGKVKQTESMVIERRREYDEVKNRILMAKEDVLSQRFNTREILAEKEYYEELLSAYQNQYQNESEVVLQLTDVQYNISTLQSRLSVNRQRIQKLRKQLQQWKTENQYDFNAKKTQSKIVQVRVELMDIEEQGNTIAKQKNCLKIAGLICMFVKNYTLQKMQPSKHDEMAEGLQFYICREGISSQLRQFLLQKTRDKPEYQTVIQNYCTVLQKMQRIVRKGSGQLTNRVVKGYNIEISQLNAQNHLLEVELKQNMEKIKQLQTKLEVTFASENIVFIQLMKEKTGKIQLESIKGQLKANASDQHRRVSKMKEIIIQSKSMKLDRQFYGSQFVLQIIRNLQKTLQLKSKDLNIATSLLNKQEKEKQRLEQKLSEAVTTWKQHSQKKKKLKKLYCKLESCETEKRKFVEEQRKLKKANQRQNQSQKQKQNKEPQPKMIESQMMGSKKLGKSTTRLQIDRKKSISVLVAPLTATANVTARKSSNLYSQKAHNFSKVYKKPIVQSQRGSLTSLLVSKFTR